MLVVNQISACMTHPDLYIYPRRPSSWHRIIQLSLILALISPAAYALGRPVIVADSTTRAPLANASIFDRNGHFAGTSGRDGRVACVSAADYPITIRYMGYNERHVQSAADTILMQESLWELPEVTVESRRKKMLHILAYAREYSTLATYTDTVSLFREKMVDFMIPDGNSSGHKGWRRPRVITSRSYYRFTDALGLDSVSDRCNHHFTWSDWIGIPPTFTLRSRLTDGTAATDTVNGKYSAAEIWTRGGDRLSIDIDVLADTAARRWTPALAPFMSRDNIGFEQMRLRLNYSNPDGSDVLAEDLTGYSFNIETRGRGHRMFKFNRNDEPYFVTTYTEVYVLDKEYIPMSEAAKWEKINTGDAGIEICRAPGAPELQPSVASLIARVGNIDHENVRKAIVPDPWLAGIDLHARPNIGREVIKRLKGMFGIDYINASRKHRRQWKEFKKERIRKSKETAKENLTD